LLVVVLPMVQNLHQGLMLLP